MTDLHAAAAGDGPVLAASLDQWRARAAWGRDLRRREGGVGRVGLEEGRLPPMTRDTPLADLVGAA